MQQDPQDIHCEDMELCYKGVVSSNVTVMSPLLSLTGAMMFDPISWLLTFEQDIPELSKGAACSMV